MRLLPLLLLAPLACSPRDLRSSERVLHVREPVGAGCGEVGCRWAIAELVSADGDLPRLRLWTGGSGVASKVVARGTAAEAEAAERAVRKGRPLASALPASFATALPPPGAPRPLPASIDTPLGPGSLRLEEVASPPSRAVWTAVLHAGGGTLPLHRVAPGARPRAGVVPAGAGMAVLLVDLSGPGFTLRDAIPLDLASGAARWLAGSGELSQLARAAALDPWSAEVALACARALAGAGRVDEATAELRRAVDLGGEPLRIRARRMPELSLPAFADLLRPREVQGFDRAGGRR